MAESAERSSLYLHKPVALWGEQEVLSQDGVIFEENQAVAESEGELPHIYGPPELVQKFTSSTLDFDKICQPRELKIVSLDADSDERLVSCFQEFRKQDC